MVNLTDKMRIIQMHLSGKSNRGIAAELDLFEYIEVVYNRTRIHTALGDLSPVEFEKANWPEEDGRQKAA